MRYRMYVYKYIVGFGIDSFCYEYEDKQFELNLNGNETSISNSTSKKAILLGLLSAECE